MKLWILIKIEKIQDTETTKIKKMHTKKTQEIQKIHTKKIHTKKIHTAENKEITETKIIVPYHGERLGEIQAVGNLPTTSSQKAG